MPNIITLNEIKAYLRISYSDDDVLLAMLIGAAQEYAEEYCGHSLNEHPDMPKAEVQKPPEKFKLALYYLVGHWYENRALLSDGNMPPRELPFSTKALLDQTRRIPL